ncbi:hypothetical protein CUMW_280570 [Citrus unshiu]|uniref:Uncharacterized protein n=1 Tax=Citrus unshiu TaxID=55188 RepID=A0A2H5MUR2_CITUN|nr:hypothetical protein CUMW_280570 [Citrus unshiu]
MLSQAVSSSGSSHHHQAASKSHYYAFTQLKYASHQLTSHSLGLQISSLIFTIYELTLSPPHHLPPPFNLLHHSYPERLAPAPNSIYR